MNIIKIDRSDKKNKNITISLNEHEYSMLCNALHYYHQDGKTNVHIDDNDPYNEIMNGLRKQMRIARELLELGIMTDLGIKYAYYAANEDEKE